MRARTLVRDDSGVIRQTGGVRRFGQVIRVLPDQIEAYERLHADPWPGVTAAINAANTRNYSIYRHGELLFAYFEYVGEDFDADMKAMAADPVIQEWWARTDAMQDPFPERTPGDWWLTIPEIFHTD
jgi:L-rhamnose mutarotase